MAEPKDAAAVVLTRGNQICWARRSLKLNFLGGWHAFPGGKLEKSDAETRVENCDDKELSALIACAARECFEETGVLLVRGGEKLTKGQRASLHDDLLSGRFSFTEILAHWNLWLGAADFTFVGAWTTPAFSPVRFKTRFFLVECPPKQEPYAASGELETIEFIEVEKALQQWKQGKILCAPPILNTLRVMSEPSAVAGGLNRENKTEKLLQLAEAEGANPRKIEFNPFITCFPLKTITLPPATHTNCFIVGSDRFAIIDPASPFADEQTSLAEYVGSLVCKDKIPRYIIITHEHPDHTGGAMVLREYLRDNFDLPVPIFAHRLTAQALKGKIEFDGFLGDRDFLLLAGENGETYNILSILHTPGHAQGHVSFYDEEIGFLLSSDNVVGTGSVLIAPPEGNMSDYLNSLERLKNLPNLRFLCGSHGAAIANAQEKIESYIAHRLEREQNILKAWKAGARTPSEIVEIVYADTRPELRILAEKSVEAHLEKLREDRLIENLIEN